METNKDLLQNTLNKFNEGIIIIDNAYNIIYSNNSANEILGISLINETSHPKGRIANGDIVIIADSALGNDDGNLTPEDLKCINIKDKNLNTNDMLVAVGVYNNKHVEPQYKLLYNSSVNSSLSINTNFLGFNISSEINFFDSNAKITVNDVEFKMHFFNSIGHIVIIDSNTGKIKFYQDRGYTLRKESLKEILSGKEFLKKENNKQHNNLSGINLNEIIEYSLFIETISNVLDGKADSIIDQFLEINKRLTICNIFPLQNEDNITGALLRIEDASSLETLITQRNLLIEQIERLQNKHIDFNNQYNKDPFPNLFGNSPSMRQVKYFAEKASKSMANVLITGDSGTGKSRLALEIHNSGNPETPFVEVNCASIPHSLFESELFGYVGGAFTGALKIGKLGYFEMADGGTLFLDEIGEIPIEIQVKLLQALQNKKIYRLGSATPINVNVRVIAATNMNISKAIEDGIFRLDLYYRLNVFPINIPPLKDRLEDIYILANNILCNICHRYNLPNKQLSASSIEKISRYDWPGNVRELENVLERAVTLCSGKIIFPEYINIISPNDYPINQTPKTLKEVLEETKLKTIEETLIQCNGNKAEAMKLLNISKSTFYDYINKYKTQ